MATMSDAGFHYWHPVPHPENRRHAFAGGRRWDGTPSETLCGVSVPMAAVSETDWIIIPTCSDCWAVLLSEPPGESDTCFECPGHSSQRDRRAAARPLERPDT